MHTAPQNIPKQATDGMSNGTQFQPMASSELEKMRRSLPLCLFLFQGEFLDTHTPDYVLRADQVYRDLGNEKSHDDDDDD